jgi:ABC-type xylose transport system permease subunit
MLPVAVGLIIIWTVFSILNPVFLLPNNLVNLLFDCSTVGIISLGIVCVLMVGEIDLSVGSMSGVASAILGVLWVNQGMACRRRHPRRGWYGAADRRSMRSSTIVSACRASWRHWPAC